MTPNDKYLEEAGHLQIALAAVSSKAELVVIAGFLRARDERVRTEARAEALEEASRSCSKAAGFARPDSGTVAGLNVATVYLEAKAKEARAGLGDK